MMREKMNRLVWRIKAFAFALTRGYDIRTAWYITGVFMEPDDGAYDCGDTPQEAVLTELSYQCDS